MQTNSTNKSQAWFTSWSPRCLAPSVVNHTVLLGSIDLICIKLLMQLFVMHGLPCMLVSPIMPMHLPLITVNNDCLLVCCSKYCKSARVWPLQSDEWAKKTACLSPPTTSDQQSTKARHAEQSDTFLHKYRVNYVCLCAVYRHFFKDNCLISRVKPQWSWSHSKL